MGRLVIFHTSDLHNRLNQTLVDFLRSLKQSVPDSLLLDSGDAVWAGNIFWRPGGEPVLDLMNSVPYDAMCLGNREFHFLGTGLKSKICRARFPILSANLRSASQVGAEDTDKLSCGVASHVVFERGGLRVGVFGLTVPCITEQMFVRRLADHFFLDPIETALKLVPTLRSQCDVVVGLTHIGFERDLELVRGVPGIDLVLGGHSHIVAKEVPDDRDVLILHHGHHCRFVGRVDVEVCEGDVRLRSSVIPISEM